MRGSCAPLALYILPARGADRGHVDVTVAPLGGQIRHLFIETCESVLPCSGNIMRHGGQQECFQQTPISE
jgi:hypothetical protein